MYSIQGFGTDDTEHGCDAERTADTLKSAKQEARYMLSKEYARASEAPQLARAQIFKGGQMVDEYFAK